MDGWDRSFGRIMRRNERMGVEREREVGKYFP